MVSSARSSRATSESMVGGTGSCAAAGDVLHKPLTTAAANTQRRALDPRGERPV